MRKQPGLNESREFTDKLGSAHSLSDKFVICKELFFLQPTDYRSYICNFILYYPVTEGVPL